MEINKIPKIIHQIWLGSKKKPEWCMNSWKIDYINQNPEWEYRFWDEEEINKLSLINKKQYNDEKNVRGKSDIVRYEILYQFGGIYIDSDSLCINPNKSLNNLINNKTFIAGREPKNKQFVANGVIGCNINNQNIYKMIDFINKNYYNLKKKYPKDNQIWLVTNQPQFTKICEENNCHIYDSNVFYPEDFIKNNINIPIEDIKLKYKNSYMFQYWLSHYG